MKDDGPADNIPLALLGWVTGCSAIWSALFLVGSLLYGRYVQALVLAVVFTASGSFLAYATRRLWAGAPAAATRRGAASL
jgi:hypothetical protein